MRALQYCFSPHSCECATLHLVPLMALRSMSLVSSVSLSLSCWPLTSSVAESSSCVLSDVDVSSWIALWEIHNNSIKAGFIIIIIYFHILKWQWHNFFNTIISIIILLTSSLYKIWHVVNPFLMSIISWSRLTNQTPRMA